MIKIKIMLVGDSHGGTFELRRKLNLAGKLNIQHVVVLGDFGLWDHILQGHLFLDNIQAAADKNNLSVYALPGNHENYDHWDWYVENMPTSKGFALIRSRILLAPKIHHWVWDHKQFISAGGAVSIDKADRLYREMQGDQKQWWSQEQLTDEDVAKIDSWGKTADYLLTHDCSNYTDFKYRLKPDLESSIHRQRIDKVLRVTKPTLHFHGHMHEQYDWINGVSFRHEHFAQTYGLECDDGWYSYGILDTETDKFIWRHNDN